MKHYGWIISKYLVRAILPYFAISWLLLSVILFVQQASRFSDIFFNANISGYLVFQLAVALLPNVVAFTCPAAMLVGVVIGLAKMQTDSELVAIRATGVGNLQIAVPIAAVGLMLSGFAFLVNIEGIPLAARLARQVAIQTAIKKLESPIEPGAFNREVNGYTIYVRDGDVETGRWHGIFIYGEDRAGGSVRLITSENGRVDVSEQHSELVLNDATVSTLPIEPGKGVYATERLGEIRFAVKTSRGDIIERLSKGGSIDELGLMQLADYAAASEGREQIEARIVWQRRIVLSLTPFIFSLLGTAMILRFSRGGRGLGIMLALLALIGYYLLAFLGEQLARTGYINVALSGLFPIAGGALAILWFQLSGRAGLWNLQTGVFRSLGDRLRRAPEKMQARNFLVDLTTGLRDLDISLNLVKYFLLSMGFILAMFLTFTAFDIWKFAGTMEGGIPLLLKYLLFLVPFAYLQLAPSSAMIAILATYVIKSRQNEIVTWTAAGQSVYRMLLPCFVLTALLGVFDWQFQERVVAAANRRQEDLRVFIRGGGIVPDLSERKWAAVGGRIYSYIPESDNDQQSGEKSASDNEDRSPSSSTSVRQLTVYDFAANNTGLQSVYRSQRGRWSSGMLDLKGNVEKDDMLDGKISTEIITDTALPAAENPLAAIRDKPSQLTIAGLRELLTQSDASAERRSLAIAFEKKYSTIALPFVIALFTAPFALSLSRKGKAMTIGYAVGLWLLFTGVSSIFEQLGLNAYLPSSLAVWAPLVVFALFGVYLLSKVKT
jgi:lipopolysaccharide export LptBFGC system permease protein LptF